VTAKRAFAFFAKNALTTISTSDADGSPHAIGPIGQGGMATVRVKAQHHSPDRMSGIPHSSRPQFSATIQSRREFMTVVNHPNAPPDLKDHTNKPLIL
jgi:hypothetical protein